MIQVEMANDSRRLMTPRAAADRLGVSYSTFKQWIYKGSVRTVRTSGGHHRIAESEVERLLSSTGRAAEAGAVIPAPVGRARVAERPQPAARALSRKCGSKGSWRRSVSASANSA